MKILTWNLYNLFDEKKELYKENGEKYFLPIDFVSRRELYYSNKIKEINPDIVFFQEVGSEKILQKIVKESMGENCFVFLAEKDKRGIANACASKVPLTFSEISVSDLTLPRFKIDKEEYKVSEHRERPYILAKMKTGNDEEINLIGVHFKSKFRKLLELTDGTFKKDENTLEAIDSSIRSLVIKIAEIKSFAKYLTDNFKDKNLIIVGDYNDDYKGIPANILEKLDLKNAAVKLKEEERYSHYFREYRVLLDNIMLTSSLYNKIKNIKIYHDFFKKEEDIKIENFEGSDHAPVLLEITQ